MTFRWRRGKQSLQYRRRATGKIKHGLKSVIIGHEYIDIDLTVWTVSWEGDFKILLAEKTSCIVEIGNRIIWAYLRIDKAASFDHMNYGFFWWTCLCLPSCFICHTILVAECVVSCVPTFGTLCCYFDLCCCIEESLGGDWKRRFGCAIWILKLHQLVVNRVSCLWAIRALVVH